MQRYTVYSYLETALYVSGGTATHHQGRIQLYLKHLVFVTPLLLPAAIVDSVCAYEFDEENEICDSHIQGKVCANAE
jgi:hypothetical protein